MCAINPYIHNNNNHKDTTPVVADSVCESESVCGWMMVSLMIGSDVVDVGVE